MEMFLIGKWLVINFLFLIFNSLQLTDVVVWGILISNLGATFGNQIFNQLGPQYLSKALGMHPKNAGFAAALPFLLAAAIKMLAGPISDKIGKRLSERTRVILFTSISQV